MRNRFSLKDYLTFFFFSVFCFQFVQGQVIISQYYEGLSNNKWIEITNMGTSTINLASPQLYLCQVTGTAAVNPASAGSFATLALTGNLASGASLLYRNSGTVLPSYASGTSTGAVNFNGTFDVVFLSTAFTPQATAWANRTDMFGPLTAGSTNNTSIADISYVRNAAITAGNVGTSTGHNPAEWTSFALATVDAAANTQTEYLGVHNPIATCTPTKLVFAATIGNQNQDNAISDIEVQLQTALSALCTYCTSGTVTLTFTGCGLYGGTGGTSVTTDSTATVAVSAGKATFTGLKIKRSVQNGVTFKATYSGSCGTLTAANSNSFIVDVPIGGTLVTSYLKDDNFSSGAVAPWAYSLGVPGIYGSGGSNGVDVTSVINVSGNDFLRKTYSVNNTAGQKGSIRTVTFAPISISGTYTSLDIGLKVASSMGITGSGAGVDSDEYLYVETQINNSGIWLRSFYLDVNGGNTKWDFSPSQSITLSYNANQIFLVNAGTYKNDFTITFPTGVTSVQFRVVAANNRSEEGWDIDDVKLRKIDLIGTGLVPSPMPTAVVSDISICAGGSGSLLANSSNAASPISYSWTPATNLSSTTIQNPTANPATTTTYTVNIADDDGCKTSAIATVTVGKPGQASVTALPICGGSGTSTLIATGAPIGYDYLWYSDTTLAAIQTGGAAFTTPTLGTSTDYYVSVYSPSSLCESWRVKITVTVAPVVSAPTTTGASICFPGGVLTLNASGAGAGEDYKWYDVLTGGNLLQTNGASYSPSIATTTDFYVTLYNTSSDCESNPRVVVTATIVPSVTTPSFTAGATTLCQDAADETYTATAINSTGITYSVAPLSAGTIDANTGVMNWDADFSGSATITASAAGCNGPKTADLLITIKAKPAQPSVIQNAFCGSVLLSVTNPLPINYSWFDNAGGVGIPLNVGATYPTTTAGTFYVSAEDNGCLSAMTSEIVAHISGQATIIPATDGNTHIANFECIDALGWTHYGFDPDGIPTNNDGDEELILSLYKGANNIGTVGNVSEPITVQVAGNLCPSGAPYASGAVHIAQTATNYVQSSDWWVMNRFWQVSPHSQPSTDIPVRFYFKDADFQAVKEHVMMSAATDIYFYKINGAAYSTFTNPNPATNHDNIPAATSYNANGYHQYTNGAAASTTTWAKGNMGLDHYAEFVVGQFSGGGGGASSSTGAFPIELLSFEGYGKIGYNVLNWHTLMEIGMQYFTIERAKDGKNFYKIGTLPAKNQSDNTYAFQDNAPMIGHNYYRLAMIDNEGKIEYSSVIDILQTNEFTFSVYPNPAADNLNISLFGADYDTKFTLVNMLGVVVREQSLAPNTVHSLNLSGLSKGVYVYSLSYLGKNYEGKLIVK